MLCFSGLKTREAQHSEGLDHERHSGRGFETMIHVEAPMRG